MRLLLAAIALGAVAAILLAPAFAPGGAFGAHAVRFGLVTYVVVPLALVLLAARLPAAVVRALAVASRPPVAFALFCGGLALAFAAPCVDAARGSPVTGGALALGWTATAAVAWWGACAPPDARGRLREPAAMALLFALGVPHQVVAGVISTRDAAFYAGVTLADQRAGGLLLWVPGGLLLWVAITALWLRWSLREGRKTDDAPPLTMPGDRAGRPGPGR